jgi:hypothetical protein
MRYFFLEPEAAGWDYKSVADWQTKPPVIHELNYEFDFWLGDALLESVHALIVTDHLRTSIEAAALSGASFDRVKVCKSEQFEEHSPDLKLPNFAWMKVAGKAGQDDFGTASDWRLVVSERALKLIQRFGISHAKVADYRG